MECHPPPLNATADRQVSGEVSMECHKCQHREDIESGKYYRAKFENTPCAACELKENSVRTIEFDPKRPAFTVGDVGEAESAVIPDGEVEDKPGRLPVDVMETFVRRLMELPPDVRDVVCWRFSGMSYPEIGRLQGITTAGAEARHERAMRKFPELQKLFVEKIAKKRRRKPHVRAETGQECSK